MPDGARTPAELETLLEDAFLLCDNLALVQLFEPTAVLVAGGGLDDAVATGRSRGSPPSCGTLGAPTLPIHDEFFRHATPRSLTCQNLVEL